MVRHPVLLVEPGADVRTGIALITGTPGRPARWRPGDHTTTSSSRPRTRRTSTRARFIRCRANISVSGPNGSIAVTLPVLSGYTFNVYVGTTIAARRTWGSPRQVRRPARCRVRRRSLPAVRPSPSPASASSQIPPAAPTTGVTVYPNFIFGRGAYGQIMLDDTKFTYLKEADKSDPLNQLRVVGWKTFLRNDLLKSTIHDAHREHERVQLHLRLKAE